MENKKKFEDLGGGWQLFESNNRPGFKYLYNTETGSRHWATKGEMEPLVKNGSIRKVILANPELKAILKGKKASASLKDNSTKKEEEFADQNAKLPNNDESKQEKETSKGIPIIPSKSANESPAVKKLNKLKADEIVSSPTVFSKIKEKTRTPAQDRLKRLQNEFKSKHDIPLGNVKKAALLRKSRIESKSPQKDSNTKNTPTSSNTAQTKSRADLSNVHQVKLTETPNKEMVLSIISKSSGKKETTISGVKDIGKKIKSSKKKEKLEQNNLDNSTKDVNMNINPSDTVSFASRAKNALISSAKSFCKKFLRESSQNGSSNQPNSIKCQEEFAFIKKPKTITDDLNILKSNSSETFSNNDKDFKSEETLNVDTSSKIELPLNSDFASQNNPFLKADTKPTTPRIRKSFPPNEKEKLRGTFSKQKFKHASVNDRLKSLRKILEVKDNTAKNEDDNIERMEWEPSAAVEINENRSFGSFVTLIKNDFTPPSTPIQQRLSTSLPINTNTTKEKVNFEKMGDALDTIGKNILRMKAESQRTKIKWHNNSYYIVLDTNILLEQIAFIKDLLKLKIPGTDDTIIYIPYKVLQELDKLKQFSPKESVKTKAIRAINFLNEHLEYNSTAIQAQTAEDEGRFLISVKSPDDSILNCCLQVKKNVANILLLSEDTNLRNKAASNNILVSTKYDLTKSL